MYKTTCTQAMQRLIKTSELLIKNLTDFGLYVITWFSLYGDKSLYTFTHSKKTKFPVVCHEDSNQT